MSRAFITSIALFFATNVALSQETDILPGFSEQRLQTAAEITVARPSLDATSEAARFVWTLRRFPPEKLASVTSRTVTVEGRARKIDAVRLPAELAEVLEFERLYRVVVESDGRSLTVISSDAPDVWSQAGEELDEPITLVGVSASETVVFTSQIEWVPNYDAASAESPWPLGWRLLGRDGFDCGLLSGLSKRGRASLGSGENAAFYGMLAVARKLGQATGRPAPESIELSKLLADPKSLIGQWIRLDLETARVTRIAVPDEGVGERLVSDHYWQIDAFGSLPDNLRIELEPAEPGGEPLVFENRFPVSLVTVTLPEWILSAPAGSPENQTSSRVDMKMVSRPVSVDGFFYRMWSYESEFSSSRGGKQVAPLVVVASFADRSSVGSDVAQVRWFGWLMAAGVLGTILVTSITMWRINRRDAEIRANRR